MKKALIVTSVGSMVDQFLMPSMLLLQDMGYEVHVACNFEKGNTCSAERIELLKKTLEAKKIVFYQLDCERDVLQFVQNGRAYKHLKRILSEHTFDIIHCHSPIGGLLGRLAARKARRKGARVFYTAHGFHFYEGAPLKNWLCYYPIERLCSRCTDVLITINHEDYALASKKMKAKQVVYVPGVGIDVTRFDNITIDRAAKRRSLGIPEDATLLVSVGEISIRKNHKIIMQALTKIEDEKLHYIIVGKGPLTQELQDYAKEVGISHKVHLLGFRTDVAEIYAVSDICCFPSIQEGLPVALMEAMASGLPVVFSKIRGSTDLIDLSGGMSFDPQDADACYQALTTVLTGDTKAMGRHNKERVQDFAVDKISARMKTLYES